MTQRLEFFRRGALGPGFAKASSVGLTLSSDGSTLSAVHLAAGHSVVDAVLLITPTLLNIHLLSFPFGCLKSDYLAGAEPAPKGVNEL